MNAAEAELGVMTSSQILRRAAKLIDQGRAPWERNHGWRNVYLECVQEAMFIHPNFWDLEDKQKVIALLLLAEMKR